LPDFEVPLRLLQFSGLLFRLPVPFIFDEQAGAADESTFRIQETSQLERSHMAAFAAPDGVDPDGDHVRLDAGKGDSDQDLDKVGISTEGLVRKAAPQPSDNRLRFAAVSPAAIDAVDLLEKVLFAVRAGPQFA